MFQGSKDSKTFYKKNRTNKVLEHSSLIVQTIHEQAMRVKLLLFERVLNEAFVTFCLFFARNSQHYLINEIHGIDPRFIWTINPDSKRGEVGRNNITTA